MKFPKWLRQKLVLGPNVITQEILDKNKLNTVCFEAKCPNIMRCYSKKIATFLALGTKCTRNCGFCDIDFDANPSIPDINEPKNIAKATKEMNLRHVVITMVTRDDLPDQGANHISQIIQEIKKLNPSTTVEVLTSDFSKKYDLIDIVINEQIDIFNHNIETVRSLTPKIRHIATYDTSLEVLKYVKSKRPSILVKSGLMVGMGESLDEVKEAIKDLKESGCDIITIGQYLQANKNKYKVKEYIHPDIFKKYEKYALSIGVKCIYSSPFVRSSFNAEVIKNKTLQG
ncbi:MAG: Lipoyl synthase [Candidatus Anoxychlamydiales bacterium]|nr:Lipoyl synthase [Candidatus Anoxychlamydiales bacterium]